MDDGPMGSHEWGFGVGSVLVLARAARFHLSGCAAQ